METITHQPRIHHSEEIRLNLNFLLVKIVLMKIIMIILLLALLKMKILMKVILLITKLNKIFRIN